MDALNVTEPSSTSYYRGGSFYLNGTGLNPDENYTWLMLGTTIIHPYSSSNSYAYFDIPYDIELGTYTAMISNSIDTITLSNPIMIIAK